MYSALTPTMALLILLSFYSRSASPISSPFAAYQVFVWPNETTNAHTQVNSPFNYTCALPVAYSLSYQRSLALAGFYFANTMVVGFTANIVLSSGFNQVIQIILNQAMNIYQLSQYIILVSTPQFWVWSIVGNYNLTQLNNYAGSPLIQTTTITTSQLAITNVSNFQFCAVIVDYEAQSNNAAAKIDVSIKATSLIAPNSIVLTFQRYASRVMRRVGYNILILNTTFMTSEATSYYSNSIEVSYSNPTTHHLFDVQQANFNIPGNFLRHNLTNDQCMLGVFLAMVNPLIKNFIFFNATTTPFHDMTVQLQNNISSIYNFNVSYNIFCLASGNSSSFYNTSTGHIQSCSSNCSQCDGLNSCLKCQISYFLINGNCFNCSQVYDNCKSCSNTTCLTCLDRFVWDSLNQVCLKCLILLQNCISCNLTYCWQCQTGFVARKGVCQCAVGWYLDGLCTKIAGCTSLISYLEGSQICLSCDSSSFISQPKNGVCECLQGTLVNNICNNIPGCISPQLSANNQIVCKFCKSTSNFSPAPSSNGLCQCSAHFKLVGDACTEICGDGILMTASQDSCDDGNTESGDGCSSVCKTQPFYQCYNGSSTSPSVCIYLGKPLQISLQAIRRNTSANQGFFSFKVIPALSSLNKMDLSNLLSLKCDSSYNVSEIKYINGELQLVVDYAKDMEGVPCNLTLSYVQSLVKSPASILSFNAVSNDTKLLVSNHLETVSMAKFNFRLLSFIILGIFVVSLGHKMIGAELIVSCQTLYLSCSMFGEPTFVFDSIYSLNPVNGMSYLLGESQFKTLLNSISSTSGAQITCFLQNTTLVTSILTSILMLLGLLNARYFYAILMEQNVLQQIERIQAIKESVKQQTRNHQRRLEQLRNQIKTIKKLINLAYNSLLFPFTSAFFLVLYFSLYVANIRQSVSNNSRLLILESMAQVLFLAAFGIVLSVEIINVARSEQKSKDFIGLFSSVPNSYSLLFIVRSMVLSLSFIFLRFSSLQWLKIGILCPFFLYLSIIIIKRYYKSKLDSFGAILCQSTSNMGLILSYIIQKLQILEIYQILLIFLVQGMICISVLVTVIRVFVFYFKRICKLIKSKENILDKSVHYKLKDQMLQQFKEGTDLCMRNNNPFSLQEISRFHSIGSKIYSNKNNVPIDCLPANSQYFNQKLQEQAEQLQIAKKRLKAQFFKKKKQKKPKV